MFPESVLGTGPRLLATPNSGHPRDTIYLSGSGFPAHARVTLLMTCSKLGESIKVSAGPATDAHGQFVAYPLSAPRGAPSTSTPCTVEARSGRTVTRTTYTLHSPRQALSHCVRTICLSIKAVLAADRSGAEGAIETRGWPGARVDITVSVPGQKAARRTVRLSWSGVASVRLWVASGLKKAVQARILARARLGAASGTGTGRFTVIPGGR